LERFVTWALDALLVVAAIAAAFFLYRASQGSVMEAPSVALIGIGMVLVPLGLSIAAHNWVMRARILRRDAE
jgi:hypothetical protein